MADTPTPTPTPAPVPADISDADERAQHITSLLKNVIAELTGGWRAWVSPKGDLYATCPRDRTARELERGLVATVVADTPADLVEQLHEQMRLESQFAAVR